jgi:hypothetical protein
MSTYVVDLPMWLEFLRVLVNIDDLDVLVAVPFEA